jgi:hypothetical protein
MPSTAPQTSHASAFHHRLGDRVVIELTGTVISRNAENDVYSIQPDDPRSPSLLVQAKNVFPEDSEPTPCPASRSFADVDDAVFRTVCFVTALEAAVDGDLRHAKEGWNSASILLGEARKAATEARNALACLDPPLSPASKSRTAAALICCCARLSTGCMSREIRRRLP